MAKIHKLSKNGQTIYPATTTDAVAHPTLKVSASKLIGEINVSNLYPTGGTDGTNKYTLASAIAKIPTDLRTVGIKCSFLSDAGTVEEWVYQGGTFTNTESWMQGGGGSGGNMILEWNTDVATTRKQVKQKQRKSGIQISYLHPDNGWINEQYVGTTFTDTEWAKDTNWDKVISESQIGKLAKSKNIFSKGLVNGRRISLYGADEEVAGAVRTDYLPVEANSYYYTNKVFTKREVYSVNFFTSDKTFITGAYLGNLNIFKTPENCAYVILNVTAKTYYPIISSDGLTLSEDEVIIESIGNYEIVNNNYERRSINLLNPLILPITNSQYVYVRKTPGKKCSFVDSRIGEQDKPIISAKYYVFTNEDGFIESDYLNSDFFGITINLLGIDSDTIRDILSQIMVYELDETYIPKPFIDYHGNINSEQIATVSLFGYGNINEDVSMLTADKNSFTKLSVYSIDTAYSYLIKENGKKVIYYPEGLGWLSGDTEIYKRSFAINYPQIVLTNSCKLKQFFAPFCSSVIVETNMPIVDLVKTNGFFMSPLIGNIAAGYFNEFKKLQDDTDVVEVTVGETYRLITYNSNKAYTYIQYIKVLSENSFKITFPHTYTFGNSNVESLYHTGKPVEFNPTVRMNIGYTTTKDYWIKIHSPKYNISSIYPDSFFHNRYSISSATYGANIYNIDTDVSSVPQIMQKDESDNFWIKNPFLGTKIVWLGTSVPNEPPFGEGKTKKYPEFVAPLLQTNVTIRAIGGTKMTYNPDEGVYGLSMTLEEYNSHQSEAGAERSYETQLDGCWDSDLFVFDHLHNDNGLLASLKDNPEYWDSDLHTFKITESNKFDRTWAVGAFNYVIAEIFRFNPRAKIAIINDWRAEPFYNKLANRVVADLWGIPICELRMCNGNVDITTTKDTYLKRYNGGANIKLLAGSSANPLYYQTKSAPDESSSVAEEETEITFNKGSDSIHPGRYGRIVYAKAVARWMLGNVILDNDTLDFWY